MEINIKNEQYDSINIMRIICAIFVIAFHTNIFSMINKDVEFILNNFIFNIAVPFFFICSGYFFWEKYKNNQKYIKIYVKKIIKIYIVWSVIYLPWLILSYYNNNRSFIYDLIIIIRNFLFSGVVYHLWYLTSLTYSILIIEKILRNKKDFVLILTSIVFIFIIILSSGDYNLKNFILIKIYSVMFGGIKTGIIYGVPFISIGVLINKYNIKRYIGVCKYTILIYLLFLLLAALKIYYNENLTLILTIGLLFGLFILLLNVKFSFKNSISTNIRDITLNIYCLHVLILILTSKFENLLNINSTYINIYNFILVTFISLVISIILIKVKNKSKYI